MTFPSATQVCFGHRLVARSGVICTHSLFASASSDSADVANRAVSGHFKSVNDYTWWFESTRPSRAESFPSGIVAWPPPQTIISSPVQTAVCERLGTVAPPVEVAAQRIAGVGS